MIALALVAAYALSMGTVVGVIFPLLTVIVGGACVLLFSITTTLRASNGDLRDRVDDLEKEQTKDKATIKEQHAELEALKKVVTGEVQLAALGDTSDQILRMLVRAEKVQEQIRAALERILAKEQQ